MPSLHVSNCMTINHEKLGLENLIIILMLVVHGPGLCMFGLSRTSTTTIYKYWRQCVYDTVRTEH